MSDEVWLRSAQAICVAGALVTLTACSSVRESLGLSKNSPDEFAVVTKAPLVMPPDYTLRPPQPGAPATRDASPSEQARRALLGSSGSATEGQQALLSAAGADKADPDIRAKVAGENRELTYKNTAFADQILFGGPGAVPSVAPDATVQTVSSTGESQPAEASQAEETSEQSVEAPAPAPVPQPPQRSEQQDKGGWFDWF